MQLVTAVGSFAASKLREHDSLVVEKTLQGSRIRYLVLIFFVCVCVCVCVCCDRTAIFV